jgi:P27 family predicted phage terminase small subunit
MTSRYRSGRKPKPSTIVERRRGKNITGNLRGLMAPPPELSDVAKKEWVRVVRLLKEAGLIEQLDKTLLSAYCVAYTRWVDAENQIREYGSLIKSPNGYPMPSPYLPIANKAMEQMLKIMGELGMTPASRSRLPQKEPERIIHNYVPTTPKIGEIDPRDFLKAQN